ncbi:hypothetical protein FRB94_000783 [Tulasnella sp. JGI-2019a]|nr:hypothetical protein FRB94_000783 [Tulasnella sp. JGI-2019a]
MTLVSSRTWIYEGLNLDGVSSHQSANLSPLPPATYPTSLYRTLDESDSFQSTSKSWSPSPASSSSSPSDARRWPHPPLIPSQVITPHGLAEPDALTPPNGAKNSTQSASRTTRSTRSTGGAAPSPGSERIPIRA